MHKRLKRKAHEFYTTFISLKGEPHHIAMGMAVGIFIGTTPTIPLHTILILAIIFITRHNLTAALLGAWITNPITIPIFYWTEYKIGGYLLGVNHNVNLIESCTLQELLHTGWKICVPLQLGGLILATLFAVPAYYITRKAVLVVRKKRGHVHCERSAQKV